MENEATNKIAIGIAKIANEKKKQPHRNEMK